MTIQISSTGASNALSYFVGTSTNTETLILKLYSNNVTPGPTTALADFTEVSGGGYAEKLLSASDWNVTGASATTSAQTFTFTAAVGDVYGYYLVGSTSGSLIASEKFTSGPYNVQNNGDVITVTSTISIA